MKVMITIIPVPRHNDGEISLDIISPIKTKKVDEIKDNEQALNFRTWYVETASNEEKAINFKLLNRKTIFLEQMKEISEAISIEEFKKKEISRIYNARDGDINAICRDIKELNRCLKKNNLDDKNIVYIIEIFVP